MTPETLQTLLAARAAPRAVVLATRLSDGAQIVFPDAAVPDALRGAAEAALADDQARSVTLEGETWFLHPQAPPHRLIIVGAVHIAQALAPIASATGLAVTVVDPRRGFATAERFPGVALVHDWPDDAMAALAPDRSSAVVVLTHNPEFDDPALHAALRSPAFYIGALGSRRTHAGRLGRLRDAGFDDAACARVRGPVGLAIGALTAPEIGVSILAEIIAARRGAALAAR